MGIVYLETKTSDEKIDGKIIKIHQKLEHVLSAPRIDSALSTHFQITGIGSMQEARNLALMLRAGALLAPIEILQERTIGPSLGKENIAKGVHSLEFGMAVVMMFMMVYYRLFGVFANVALLVNMLFIVAILSCLGATLTLPGIAGIVLTIGMAVDANVLIYERIREELRRGTSALASIIAGFERALATIVDSNLAALIVGVVLLTVGTGPIRGFAVTLCIGILTSMFSALVYTRIFVQLTYHKRDLNHLSIGI
jgi:preprotein translocase subunit SecD